MKALHRILFTVSLFLLYITTTTAQEVMSPELLWSLGRTSADDMSSDGKFIVFGVSRYSIQENTGNRDLYLYDIENKTTTPLTSDPKSEYHARFTPDNQHVAFLRGGSMFEVPLSGGDPVKITIPGGDISTFEFSPDGSKVAFTQDVKVGEDKSDLYPELTQSNARIIDDLMYRHWDHWEDGMRSHLFSGNYGSGQISEVKDLMNGEDYDCPLQPFGGSEDYAWHPNGKQIVYAAKKYTGTKAAESTNSDLFLVDIHSLNTRNLTESNKGYDRNPAFSPDGKRLAWLSMSTPGYEADRNQLKVMELETGKSQVVLPDFEETIEAFIWDKDGKKIYAEIGIKATYQLFEISESGKGWQPEQITRGDHNIYHITGVSNKLIYAHKMDMNHATEIYSFGLRNGAETPITHTNDESYNNLKMSKVEKRWIDTHDGKKMLTWIIYPPDFDPSKKYPALLYCQGGPQSAVSQFYSFRWNFQIMAAQGYVVIAPNRRGLPTFGEEWNREISGDWGGKAIADYMSAARYMAEEPYIDRDRIGAIGASYGGYSVYMLAGVHNGLFKTFISHCGVFNLESWYGTTEELFFANFDLEGPYWKIPEPVSYSQFSPHKFVKYWNTPIMVIHGQLDYRVPVEQGMQAFQVAKIKGLKSRFLYFPDEGHWVLKPQNGILWQKEFFKWLNETL